MNLKKEMMYRRRFSKNEFPRNQLEPLMNHAFRSNEICNCQLFLFQTNQCQMIFWTFTGEKSKLHDLFCSCCYSVMKRTKTTFVRKMFDKQVRVESVKKETRKNLLGNMISLILQQRYLSIWEKLFYRSGVTSIYLIHDWRTYRWFRIIRWTATPATTKSTLV